MSKTPKAIKATHTTTAAAEATALTIQEQVEAEADRLGLKHERYFGGRYVWVHRRTIAETEPMPYGWGFILGITLTIEALQAEQLGLLQEQDTDDDQGFGLRELMLEAAQTMEKEGHIEAGRCRKGAAMGVLFALSALALESLRSGRAFNVLQGMRERELRCAEKFNQEELQQLKELAMGARKAAAQTAEATA